MWAKDMTTDAIIAERDELCAKWDDVRRELEESGGHSGSPGEWMLERLCELDQELEKRAGI